MSMLPAASGVGIFKPLNDIDTLAKRQGPVETPRHDFSAALENPAPTPPAPLASAPGQAPGPGGKFSPELLDMMSKARLSESQTPEPVRQTTPAAGTSGANSIRRPVDKTIHTARDAAGTKTVPAETTATAAPATDAAPAQPARRKAKTAAAAAAAAKRYDSLSSNFESGRRGIEAIGHDRRGGTSYGKYQISSRAGTLDNFLKFLDSKAPDVAGRLRAAGPADTGGKEGAMPDEWRKIAAEDPKRFETLQHDFILRTHYLPALKAISQETGLNLNERSPALKEVLWSTAVQHGPNRAARIFNKAMAGMDQTTPDLDRSIIAEVYRSRQEVFVASSPAMRTAMRSRFKREEDSAMTMHNQNPKDPVSIM